MKILSSPPQNFPSCASMMKHYTVLGRNREQCMALGKHTKNHGISDTIMLRHKSWKAAIIVREKVENRKYIFL